MNYSKSEKTPLNTLLKEINLTPRKHIGHPLQSKATESPFNQGVRKKTRVESLSLSKSPESGYYMPLSQLKETTTPRVRDSTFFNQMGAETLNWNRNSPMNSIQPHHFTPQARPTKDYNFGEKLQTFKTKELSSPFHSKQEIQTDLSLKKGHAPSNSYGLMPSGNLTPSSSSQIFASPKAPLTKNSNGRIDHTMDQNLPSLGSIGDVKVSPRHRFVVNNASNQHQEQFLKKTDQTKPELKGLYSPRAGNNERFAQIVEEQKKQLQTESSDVNTDPIEIFLSREHRRHVLEKNKLLRNPKDLETKFRIYDF